MDKTIPTGAGKSSFELIDAVKFFRELNLKGGSIFLDVACGKGAYSLAASERVEPGGTVYALDLWEDGIHALESEAAVKGIRNIKAMVGDASRQISVEDDAIDACLMATVLHDFVEDGIVKGVLQEIVRVLKPAGILAVIEFNKIEGPPGPPENIRLSPDRVAEILKEYGFEQIRLTGLGPYTYLILFKATQ